MFSSLHEKPFKGFVTDQQGWLQKASTHIHYRAASFINREHKDVSAEQHEVKVTMNLDLCCTITNIFGFVMPHLGFNRTPWLPLFTMFTVSLSDLCDLLRLWKSMTHVFDKPWMESYFIARSFSYMGCTWMFGGKMHLSLLYWPLFTLHLLPTVKDGGLLLFHFSTELMLMWLKADWMGVRIKDGYTLYTV